jgi:hypothetical protein
VPGSVDNTKHVILFFGAGKYSADYYLFK